MSRRKAGFTLIELLVVVAIIALLISILLPSLSAAREQAKVAKCTANLKSIMTASYAYFGEFNDTFPFYAKTATPGGAISGVSSWTYAGKAVSQHWISWASGAVYFNAQEKPLNPYILGNVPGAWEEVLVAKCPSDVSTYQRGTFMAGDQADESVSTYDDVGISYQLNIQMMSTEANVGGSPDRSGPWRSNGRGWQENLLIILRQQSGGFGSRLTFVWDGVFDFAANAQVQVVGDHRQFSRYSFGFLDGHAGYIAADSRKWCGPNWTVLNPNWIRRIGQPGVTQPFPIRYPLADAARCP